RLLHRHHGPAGGRDRNPVAGRGLACLEARMKGRVLCLDRIGDRPAAALLLDGRLEELCIDPEGDEPVPGAIYRAVADRPVKGLGGMFVTLPGGSSFLRQTAGIASGQRVLVQVSGPAEPGKAVPRSEEHTSELQSRENLVCRLLLEKKKI